MFLSRITIHTRPVTYRPWALLLLAASIMVTALASGTTSQYRHIRGENVAQGVAYRHYQDDFLPISYNILRVKWRVEKIYPRTVLGNGHVLGLETVSVQAAQKVNDPSRYAVAAINGDFYKGAPWSGVPVGLFIVERELVSANTSGKSNRGAFIIGDGLGYNGRPDVENIILKGRLSHGGRRHTIHGINKVRKSGQIILYTPAMGKRTPGSEGCTEVVLSSIDGRSRDGTWRCYPGQSYNGRISSVRVGSGGATIPRTGAVLSGVGSAGEALARMKKGAKVQFQFVFAGKFRGIKSAIGGWPIIVENGKNIMERGGPRHPRTAIGYTDSDEVVLAVVDGRRAGWSRGMTLYELAELMVKEKCTEAINLDGGGSSTMWIRKLEGGEVRNKPSDGRERPVANAFVIYSSAPTLRLSRLVLDPPELNILINEEFQFTVSGKDKYYNPVHLDYNALKWQASFGVGKFIGKGRFYSANRTVKKYRPIEGYVKVSLGKLEKKIKINVYKEPPVFVMNPTEVHLFEGDTVQFRTRAVDHRAKRVIGSYDRILKWEAPPSLGTVDRLGFFKAGKNVTSGNVSVIIGDIIRQARVTVGVRPKHLDGFEPSRNWTYRTHPDNQVKCSFRITRDSAHQGSYGGMFRYTFKNNDENQGCYAKSHSGIPMPGRPMGVSVYVKGDGSRHELRMAIRDSSPNNENIRFTCGFTKNPLLDTNWHKVTARISSECYPGNQDIKFPVKLEEIYVWRNKEESRMSGSIKLDNLAGLYPPQ